ncbi:Mannan endo-1,4-beta-mannosidase [Paramyrothecium foliicola]|nr:Mannan endo-1,4-beta-mannosidase [Paramyrothecium foliicola]
MAFKAATLAGLFLASLAQGAVVPRKDCNSVTFEAEDAVLSGTVVEKTQAGFSGTGYVTSFDEANDKVTFTLETKADTLFDLTVRYAGIYGEKRTSVILNGGASSEVLLPATTTFSEVSGGQLLLTAGQNKVEFVSNWGWYLLDSITLTPSAPRPPHNINPKLNNPNAGASTVALYNYLRSVYGKKILSGQHEVNMVDWVTQQTGKTPAILSVDLMDYTPSRVERGTKGVAVEEAIAHSKKGGIVTLLWHWNAPTGLYDTAENPWWSGFYTRATDFNVQTALADTTNANYTLLVRDIDAIAKELKRLQDADVPILWRPVHEAEGKWFWWGAQGAEPAKKLWNLVYDRLTNHHKLTNLIWVWNSIDAAWYPGDDNVDILSTDVYAKGNGPISVQYNQLVELGKDKKLVAATELGAAPLPNLLQAYQAHWLWFALWSSGHVDNPEWNTPAVLKEVYTSDYVLTLDEIQGWRNS